MVEKRSFWNARTLRKRLKAPFRRRAYLREFRPQVDEQKLRAEKVTIVVLTYNRCKFLEWCLESLFATLPAQPETDVIVWDNASVDDTKAVCRPWVEQGKLRAIHHDQNIGTNAYHFAFKEAASDSTVFLEMDDDVLWFPEGWLEALLRPFQQLPQLGYLGANQIDDRFTAIDNPLTKGEHFYNHVAFPDGTKIAFGPARGFCTATPRRIYEEVGGFPELLSTTGQVFVSEDGHYNRAMRKAGYHRGILESLGVYHATGPSCNADYWKLFVDKKNDTGHYQDPKQFDQSLLVPGFVEYFEQTYRGDQQPR